MPDANRISSRATLWTLSVVAVLVLVAILMVWNYQAWFGAAPPEPTWRHQPRRPGDPSGFTTALQGVKPWPPNASLEEVSAAWHKLGFRLIEKLDEVLARRDLDEEMRVRLTLEKAALFNYEGQPARAYDVLAALRKRIESDRDLAESWLYTVVYTQGIASLRRGEDENCILCRGESSCILPINKAAVHVNPLGSQLAVKHFREYLEKFPDDLEVRWLLNLAHMTLGEYPQQVEPAFLIRLDRFDRSEFDLGVFRDIGDRAGVNRLNQSGGAVMDDFLNRDMLDIVISSFDPTEPMAFFRNKGDGAYEDRSKEAGLAGQVGGGLYCVQTDYNNDGRLDIFVPRGAWLHHPVRPSLLRNGGDGKFSDVTAAAGLDHAMNSGAAAWADFDNDGFLDLFVCGEKQPSRLYRNMGDSTFKDVSAGAGIPTDVRYCKGCAWIDFDNDGYPDLFLTNHIGSAQLFRNNRNGTFTDVTKEMGIDGPQFGFSCWAFDFDNDGYLDLFATSYDRSLQDVILGMQGKPHAAKRHTSKLFRNLQGKGFQDVTAQAGLDMVFATMGSNFGDFDNDGYLDFYLGTGDPNLATLVPNRLFKSVEGKRFAEITASSRTGHLQKGHAVACGDWRRSGYLDIFMEMGGAIPGDRYHNVLFLNPGQGDNWLNIKLLGAAAADTRPFAKKSNRPAIGARIKVVTGGPKPMTIHRVVGSGASFGANPLELHIGLAQATRIDLLEITWPTSGVTQSFRGLDVNQAIEITEFADSYRRRNWKKIPIAK